MPLPRVAAGLGPVEALGPLRVVVRGLDRGPPPSFAEALEPVAEAGCVEDLGLSSQIVYERAEDAKTFGALKGDVLPVDGVAALMMYTAEATEPPLYEDLSRRCHDKDRDRVRPYAKFLWLLHSTLRLLPPFTGRTLYRGTGLDLRGEYPQGRRVTWHSPSICVAGMEALRRTRLWTEGGGMTLFAIELTQAQARSVGRYSLVGGEEEVLLPAGSRLEVLGVLCEGNVTTITLRELPSKELLLDLSPRPEVGSPEAQQCRSLCEGQPMLEDGATGKPLRLAALKAEDEARLARLPPQVARAVAAALLDTTVTALDLQCSGLGAEGTRTLAGLLAGTQVATLNLENNSLGDEGAAALASRLGETSISTLKLWCNGIQAEGARALARALAGSQVTSLDLESNSIGAEGARALADALADSKLSTLGLWCNNLGPEGAKALAGALAGSRLAVLNLRGNQIQAEGAKALAAALAASRLTALNLANNSIGAEGAKALVSVLAGTQIACSW